MPLSEQITTSVAESEVCEYCDGTGEVACDEWDNDVMQNIPGVGTMRCICTVRDDE